MEQDLPERRRIVVDGSNIATEGRTMPSLAQLDEAIRAFLEEYRGFTTSDVTVVVDASFGHRIDPSEVAAFDQAVEHGEMITPPAGAIGRGDGFILRIAEKSGALVLSNDSFQEFHAERPWLFEPGRLIGGKPVPGVGWIFTPRTPVRGARSRSVTSKSKRGEKAADAGRDLSSDGLVEGPEPDSAPTRTPRGSRGRSAKAAKAADGRRNRARGSGGTDRAGAPRQRKPPRPPGRPRRPRRPRRQRSRWRQSRQSHQGHQGDQGEQSGQGGQEVGRGGAGRHCRTGPSSQGDQAGQGDQEGDRQGHQGRRVRSRRPRLRSHQGGQGVRRAPAARPWPPRPRRPTTGGTGPARPRRHSTTR